MKDANRKLLGELTQTRSEESFSQLLQRAMSKRTQSVIKVTLSPVDRVDAELMMQLIRGRSR